jgi:hypothetical protein
MLTQLRQAGEGALHPSRWFEVVIKHTHKEANTFLLQHEEWGLLNEIGEDLLLAKIKDEGFEKTFFVIADETQFGFIDPTEPNLLQVLTEKESKNPNKRAIRIPNPFSKTKAPSLLRLATLKDFQTFQIPLDKYTKNPKFLVPTE